MDNFTPLSAGPTPLYDQLKEILRQEIAKGAYRPEEQLPSETQLVQRYNISRTTVRQALNDLVNEGILYRRQGKGTFVAPPKIEQELVRLTDFVEDMAQAGLNPSSKVISLTEEAASPEVAATLGLEVGVIVMRLERLRLADGKPVAYDITWLPRRYGLLVADEDLAANTIYKILETKFDIPVLRGTYFIEACNAILELAQALEIEPDTALLLLSRVSYTDGNKAVYYQKRYFRSDSLKYRISLQRHPSGNRQNSLINEIVPVFKS